MLPLSREAFSPELSSVIAATMGPFNGLVTTLDERPPDRRAGGIRITQATMPTPSYFRTNTYSAITTALIGTGAAFNREGACWSALGETLERYCGSIYNVDDLFEGTAHDLDGPAIDLSKLIRPGRRDITSFDADKPRRWVRGSSLTSGDARWVPAAMCYLGYERLNEGESIVQNDSTGLAFSNSFEDATLRALCEVIERDVFASSWLLNRPPQPIVFEVSDLSGLDPSVASALQTRSPALTVAYMASVCGVHVVMGMAMGPGGHGVISAAASSSPRRALEKAAAEALHGWHFARTLKVTRLEVSDLKRPSDHLNYYLPPERFEHVQRFCLGGAAIRYGDFIALADPQETLSSIATALKDSGYDPSVIDLTTPDVASLGYHVARVVVPGLQPLVFGADCREVPDRRRLNVWCSTWGLSDGRLNPLPHPFP